MGFVKLKDENGYAAKRRFEKKLTFLRYEPCSFSKKVVFKDEDGEILTWETNARTKAFKSLKEGTYLYRFTVKYILYEWLNINNKIIFISSLKCMEND